MSPSLLSPLNRFLLNAITKCAGDHIRSHWNVPGVCRSQSCPSECCAFLPTFLSFIVSWFESLLAFIAFLINLLHQVMVRYPSCLFLMASDLNFNFIFFFIFVYLLERIFPALLRVRTAQKSGGAIEVALLYFTLNDPLYPLPLCLDDFPCSFPHVLLQCTPFPLLPPSLLPTFLLHPLSPWLISYLLMCVLSNYWLLGTCLPKNHPESRSKRML